MRLLATNAPPMRGISVIASARRSTLGLTHTEAKAIPTSPSGRVSPPRMSAPTIIAPHRLHRARRRRTASDRANATHAIPSPPS